jgi:hypothetical protein
VPGAFFENIRTYRIQVEHPAGMLVIAGKACVILENGKYLARWQPLHWNEFCEPRDGEKE